MTERVRFGVVNETVYSGGQWVDHVRRIEDAGVDVLLVRDHLSADALGPQWAPFSALATAAASTERLHVGTMVLSNDFRHPVVVAQEAATLAALSGGRFEMGLGAGWYEPEYRAAGLKFDRAPKRIARLQESVQIIRPLLSGETVDFSGDFYSVEGLSLGLRGDPPPLLIGAGGPKMLSFAARFADIVGILPAPIRDSSDSDSALDRLREEFGRKVDIIRDAAGPERIHQLDLCAFVTLIVTNDRRGATDGLIAERGWSEVSVEEVWSMPTVLIGTLDETRAGLAERRERFGLSYLVTSDSDLETVAQVIASL